MISGMIRPFLVGFATTLKHIFKKPITVNYPDEKIPVFPKYRGKQVLMRDENGLEKCVACGLCAVACPADAIYLEPAENDGTVQAGPRYAKVYQIHKTRCIFCGYCEEACPVSAIFMGKDYELAVYSSKDFIWDKADLLVPANKYPGRSADSPIAVFGALGDIHGDFASVAPHHGAASGRTVLALRRRRGGRRRPVRAVPAPVHFIKGNNEGFDAHRRRRAAARTCSSSRTACCGRSTTSVWQASAARSRPRWYETPAAELPHPRKGTAQGDGAGRQTPTLRARGSRGVQDARRRRRLHDARGAAAVRR